MKFTATVTAAIAALLMALNPSHLHGLATSKSTKQVNSCNRALTSALQQITDDGRNINIDMNRREIPEYWRSGSPSGRPYQLVFVLGGRQLEIQAVENIMASTQMLTIISAQIIRNCNDVAVVTYGLSNSSYTREFGLVDGRVQVFECVSPGRGEPAPRWGQQYCGV